MAKFKRKFAKIRDATRKARKEATRYVKRARCGFYGHDVSLSETEITKRLVFFGYSYKMTFKIKEENI
jgi:hypothetical protein